MAASYNKFNQFVEDLAKKKIDLSADTVFVLLTNTSPNAADTVCDTSTTPCTIKATSNAVELAAQTGYTKKGTSITVTTSSQSSGTFTWAANQVVFTAGAAWSAAFRYVVLFDDTSNAAATRSVIGWWDYGSSVTLANGDTFTVQFNSANPGTILTIA
jgi:hypothetical protein